MGQVGQRLGNSGARMTEKPTHLVAHLQFAQTNRTKPKLQKSYQANAPTTRNDKTTSEKFCQVRKESQ